MPGYKKVLVALDLSPHSAITLKSASNIASANGAKLDIVHVIEHATAMHSSDFSIPVTENLDETIRNEAIKVIEKLCKPYNIDIKGQHIAYGPVKTAINDLAKKIHADLIVVGSHQHKGIDLLLGSRANAILHLAQCDVWVVKNK